MEFGLNLERGPGGIFTFESVKLYREIKKTHTCCMKLFSRHNKIDQISQAPWVLPLIFRGVDIMGFRRAFPKGKADHVGSHWLRGSTGIYQDPVGSVGIHRDLLSFEN